MPLVVEGLANDTARSRRRAAGVTHVLYPSRGHLTAVTSLVDVIQNHFGESLSNRLTEA